MMKSIFRILPALSAIASVFLLSGCSQKTQDPITKQSFYFDTVVQVTVYDMESMSSENASAAINDAFSSCSDYEKMLSKTVEGSDIWLVNHAQGDPVSVDRQTIDLVKLGISYGDMTDGRFDITIGKAEDLWDFHTDTPSLPDPDTLEEAMKHVNYKNIRIDEDAGTISLSDPEAEIDLGGIAKGYIADRVCEVLRQDGVTSAIVSLGGNIETVGGKPDGKGRKPFKIGIETPYSDMSKITGSVEITDGTAVTSGVYERYFTVNGKEYHHILDTATGYPIDNDVLGVTITGSAGHSADCDALSTACLILGQDEGLSLIEGMDGYECAFILRDGSVVTSEGMNLNTQ